MGSKLRAAYDRAFAKIQDNILKMGTMVDQAIYQSVEALKKRDQVLAKEVIDSDENINALRFEVEEAVLALIATQQPAASDLRAAVAAMNIVVELERMADHASGIAKTVILMGDEPLLKPLIDIPRMTELSRQMLSDCLQAYIDREAGKAKAIASRDDEIDHYYKAVFDELVEIMAEKPDSVERATYLLWCAHNLERISDRVTNIAERVVFVDTGDMKELNL